MIVRIGHPTGYDADVRDSSWETKRWARRLLVAAVVFVPLYAAFGALVYHKMCQPPEVFGNFMKHVPKPTLMLMPFETMWNRARGGSLQVGDLAPDFTLETADRTSEVTLSSFRGAKPVVLVFGSYT
jgi:hypothetical protein